MAIWYPSLPKYFINAQKEMALAYIYSARGQTEFYAGNYQESVKWHQKAIDLAKNDREIWQPAAEAFYWMAKYEIAESLLKRALQIDEKSLGKDHPKVASL